MPVLVPAAWSLHMPARTQHTARRRRTQGAFAAFPPAANWQNEAVWRRLTQAALADRPAPVPGAGRRVRRQAVSPTNGCSSGAFAERTSAAQHPRPAPGAAACEVAAETTSAAAARN